MVLVVVVNFVRLMRGYGWLWDVVTLMDVVGWLVGWLVFRREQ